MRPHVRAFFLLTLSLALTPAVPARAATPGETLPGAPAGVTTWWTYSSARKIQPQTPAPGEAGTALTLRCARNETEAAQLVVRSTRPLPRFRISAEKLQSGTPGGNGLSIELLRVSYLEIERASDSHSKAGMWPDPLLPISEPSDLGPDQNHVFWVRVTVPKGAAKGDYRGALRLECEGQAWEVPVRLAVYDFALPDRMTCTTAFGFSPGEVFRYQKLETEEQRRLVLDKYLANLAAHHVSPYDPAPLDRFKVSWPEVKPPISPLADWEGLRVVTNEVHGGRGALLLYDDQPGANVSADFKPLLRIPAGGLKFTAWYRTAVPGHRFLVTFTHSDKDEHWMSGRNNDVVVSGNGQWQTLELTLKEFPEGAVFVNLHLRATTWTEQGENLGLVWFDDVSLKETGTGRELLTAGDFERKPRTELVASKEVLQAKLDFTAWDRAMEQAMDRFHFTAYQLPYPGLGGGTFHAIDAPNLLGFTEEDPEYELLMASYGGQLERHLRERGWLDRAFVYWFDEPTPDQYPFVMNGFEKIKRYSPGIPRMLTEQVEPGLVGGPNVWCPISNEYQHEPAEARRKAGDTFWWYVCTGPKAPYAGLFIDHPAPEMRIWVWQTWQRGITGLLVWQMNYWTSDAAYPEGGQPQNPYTDPMSWTSGYSTPAGQRLPWGNGDGRFIYPPVAAADGKPGTPVLEGPVDSIRWEQLRDGIEDYEYLRILRDTLEARRKDLPAADVEALAKLLVVPPEVSRSMTEFAVDGAPIEAHRQLVARAIERLSAK